MHREYHESDIDSDPTHAELEQSDASVSVPTPPSLANLISWQTLIGFLGLFAALILFFAVGFIPVFNAICDANMSFNQMVQSGFEDTIAGNEWCLIYHRKTFLFILSMIAAFGTGFGALLVAAYRRIWGSFFLAFTLAYIWFGASSIFGALSESSEPGISTFTLLVIALFGCFASGIGYNLRRLVLGTAKSASLIDKANHERNSRNQI